MISDYPLSLGNGETWQRVSRRRSCPICEKTGWCLYAGPDDAPTAAICARVESPKRCGEAGWLHRLRDDDWSRSLKGTRRRVVVDAVAPAMDRRQRDFERFAATCFDALSPAGRELLANDLGISVDALTALRVGWSGEHRAYTFPMFNAVGQVLGIRLRNRNGRKWSVRGGREGLFVPRSVGGDATARLLICEGPTDTAAMLDLGFDVVGRPSCTGGVKLLVDLVKTHRPNKVAIIADADTPGLRGANNLASALAAYVHLVRVISPPDGIKDAREWKRQGATRTDVLEAIDSAPALQLGVKLQGVAL